MLLSRKHYLFLFLILSPLISCQSSEKIVKLHGSTMGTQYHITLIRSESTNSIPTSKIKKQIKSLLSNINQQMSTYISDSEISKFNKYQQSDWFPVSIDFADVVLASKKVSKLSQGAFDITISPLIDLWGFGNKTQVEIPTDKQIQTTFRYIGYQLLEVRRTPPALRKLNKNLRIDLSAIAKGFAIDKITTYLNQIGFNNTLVEIGGEIRTQGFNARGKPWRIGIESPNNNDAKVNNSLITSNISMATSGDYRNYFVKNNRRYSHTIKPKTGKPVNHHLASVTVLDESAMIADAYATALMVLGEEKGRTFIIQNKLHANMIFRKKSKYKVWQNIDNIKIPQSKQRCVKVSGCIYLE